MVQEYWAHSSLEEIIDSVLIPKVEDVAMNDEEIKEIITNIVRDIIQTTIDEIYPRYYPKGAVEFFKEHHIDSNILNAIMNGIVFLLEQINYYFSITSIHI